MLDSAKAKMSVVTAATPALGAAVAFMVVTSRGGGSMMMNALQGAFTGALVGAGVEWTLNGSAHSSQMKMDVTYGTAAIGATAGLVSGLF